MDHPKLSGAPSFNEDQVAVDIVEKLELEYFPHYAVSCWVTDVHILREDRY